MSSISNPVILICDLISPPAQVEQNVFGPNATVIAAQATSNGELSDEQLSSCHAIIGYDKISYNKDLMAKLKNCRVIVRAGIGHDNIDKAEAKRRGIIVCNVPEYCTSEVADQTIGLLLALTRGIFQHAKQVQQKTWERTIPGSVRLEGKTFGLIGLGKIGLATARRAQGLGMNVVFFDPYCTKESGGCQRVQSLEELAKQSDVLSLHTPLTTETQNIVNAEFLQKVKRGVILLNSSRGGLMDIEAVYDAMKEGAVAACGFDALPVEGPVHTQRLIKEFEADAPWLRFRLVVTPHVAYYSKEAIIELRTKAAQEVKRVLEGKEPENRVNR